jgi:xylan 1,4-beta-xylosidase
MISRKVLFALTATSAALIGVVCVAQNVSGSASAQQPAPAVIDVDATRAVGPYRPTWNYFGADEPNFVYSENGKKLLKELAALSPTPVHIRLHNLLTTGDGTGALKWGSTNACREDAAGNPIYDWTITDRIFDAMRDAGVEPLVEVGFMPEALSTHPQPYQHTFPADSILTSGLRW